MYKGEERFKAYDITIVILCIVLAVILIEYIVSYIINDSGEETKNMVLMYSTEKRLDSEVDEE